MTHVTKVYHQESYSAISPSSPVNSHAGHTVLVTGASGGIAFATIHAFMVASAAQVILTGRNLDILTATIARLEAIRPAGCTTKMIPYESDINNLTSIEALWKTLAEDSISVDILILNAAAPYSGPLLNASEHIWALMSTNVLANLRTVDKFLAQGPSAGKVILFVSSVQVHMNPNSYGAVYGTSKMALTFLLQNMAEKFPPEEVQIINFHPGAVLTDTVRKLGYDENTLPWDNANLPASFAVWAATPQAAFLHGRFVWANWDVEELAAMKEMAEPGFLKMGLQGVEPLRAGFLADIAEMKGRV